MLILNNISFKRTDRDGNQRTILDNFSLNIEKGEFVSLFGKSGSGKTTLLNILSGLGKPSSGEVYIDDQRLLEPNSEISFVFQNSTLFPFLTVQENIEFGMKLKGFSKEVRRRKSEEILKKVGLLDHKDKYPERDKLSGGMKQRVEIAGVLADEKEIILMDEPFSALDDLTREEMQKFLLEVWTDFEKTIVFVTHNKSEAILLSDRIILMPDLEKGQEKREIHISNPRPRYLEDHDSIRIRRELTNYLRNGE